MNRVLCTEFEVRLRNELTQRAIAENAQSGFAQSHIQIKYDRPGCPGFMNVVTAQDQYTYMPFNEFTRGLGCERGNYAYNFTQRLSYPMSKSYIDLLSSSGMISSTSGCTDQVIENITAVYNENSQSLSTLLLCTIYLIISRRCQRIHCPMRRPVLRTAKSGYAVQLPRDAALAIISKLEKYNGCILADSVGLGKTFTALAVIKYYESRNKSVLVLCPKKLANNWNTYRDNYTNNPLVEDRLNYDVLFHTDLGRTHGTSNGIDLSRLRWDNYDLLV